MVRKYRAQAGRGSQWEESTGGSSEETPPFDQVFQARCFTIVFGDSLGVHPHE